MREVDLTTDVSEVFQKGYIRVRSRAISTEILIQDEYIIIAWHVDRQQWYEIFSHADRYTVDLLVSVLRNNRPTLYPFYYWFSSPYQDTPPNQTDIFVQSNVQASIQTDIFVDRA